MKRRVNQDMLAFVTIVSFLSVSCSQSLDDKQKLRAGNIQYIEIQKQFDTVSLRLTSAQVTDFVKSWNRAESMGPYKYFPEYVLTIHVDSDSLISYRTNNDLIKQTTDEAYSVGRKNYFQKIWLKQVGLSDKWYQYYPTIYDDEKKFFKTRRHFDRKHSNGIKQVLTFYNHKWVDIRGQIFYQDKIDDELLCNYTTKANDSVWLSSHK